MSRKSQKEIENVNQKDKKSRRKAEKAARKEERRGNAQVLIITYCVVAVFLGMIGYLVYFMAVDADEVINNPYNKRQELLAKRTVRGTIYSSDKKVLAKTEKGKDGSEKRYYPYNDVFCHAVGRVDNSMTGVELSQCYPLLTSHSNPLKQLINIFRGEKSQGDSVITTLDAGLQKTAYDALGGYKGAVVALEPSTGKILTMLSKPDYDPNTVLQEWDELVEDSEDNSALLNRATQGLYPPGSTFKIMTAMEYIMENKEMYKKYRYICDGSDSFEGNNINCYGGESHGALDLKNSFAKSCNTSFANIGVGLNISSFRKLCERFGFNKKIKLGFENNKSSFVLDNKSDKGEIVQTAIGQGKTQITPMFNAMITSALANNGEMMRPYIVDHTENEAGRVVKQYNPDSMGQIVDKSVAEIMKRLMKEVVNSGTGTSLSGMSYRVAGKTGSAEFDEEGTSHAWFVGFAPADNPKIAVSIVVEGAGTGSQYAIPIAKKMFEEYLG